MSKIRVLHCNNDNKNMGGAYLVERKLEQYMRRYGYIFDYITMDEFIIRGNKETDPLKDSRIFSARLRNHKVTGHIRLPFYVKKVLKNNPYQIVHIDTDSAWKALLYAIPAKKSGAKVLIHSHASGIDGSHKVIKSILHRICKRILAKYADKYIGCSKRALEWLCPEKLLSNAEVLINGINREEYFYDEELRLKTREELDIKEKFVLCNVGRINDNKNQAFLVDVLCGLKVYYPDAVLLLVGPYTKEDYDKLIGKIDVENMRDSVIIAGETDQVNKYLNAADFFVLPSIFEGMPLASIEAQSVGLKCLLSTGTPPEVKMTKLVNREPLNSGANIWAKKIYNESVKPYHRCPTKINSINTMDGMAQHLFKIYSKLTGG